MIGIPEPTSAMRAGCATVHDHSQPTMTISTPTPMTTVTHVRYSLSHLPTLVLWINNAQSAPQIAEITKDL